MTENAVSDSRDRQREEREAKRKQILDVAREMFAEQGYDLVTMRGIAKRLRHTATALYSYFKNKEALFNELCAQDFLSLRRAFEQIAEEDDPVERLKRIGHAYVEHALAHPNHYRLMFMTQKVAEIDYENTPIDRGNPDQDAYAFLKAAVAEALASGRLKHKDTDADQITQILWAGVHGIISLHMTHANDPWIEWRPIARSAEMMIEIMILGLTENR